MKEHIAVYVPASTGVQGAGPREATRRPGGQLVMHPPVPEGRAYCRDSQMGGRQVTLRNKLMEQVSECMEGKESQMFHY